MFYSILQFACWNNLLLSFSIPADSSTDYDLFCVCLFAVLCPALYCIRHLFMRFLKICCHHKENHHIKARFIISTTLFESLSVLYTYTYCKYRYSIHIYFEIQCHFQMNVKIKLQCQRVHFLGAHNTTQYNTMIQRTISINGRDTSIYSTLAAATNTLDRFSNTRQQWWL